MLLHNQVSSKDLLSMYNFSVLSRIKTKDPTLELHDT